MKHENKIKNIQNETNTGQKINELKTANAELTKNMENLMKIFDSSKLVYETTGSGPSLETSSNADALITAASDPILLSSSKIVMTTPPSEINKQINSEIEMSEFNSPEENRKKLDQISRQKKSSPSSFSQQRRRNYTLNKNRLNLSNNPVVDNPLIDDQMTGNNDLGGGQRGGGIEELKQALTNLNTNLEASIPPNLLRQTQTQIPVLKSNELLARNSAIQSNTSVNPDLSASGFRQSDIDLATANSLRDHFSTLTEGQTAALQKELNDIKALLQGRVASAAASSTGMGTSGPSTSFDLSEEQLKRVLNDSYMQIIQYLKLVQKIVEKKPNDKLKAKIDAALAALQITDADGSLSEAGLDVEKIKQISNNKVSGIADILFSLLGMGIITSTALGGRKTQKHGKGKKRRQSLKRVHNKKYRIQLYSKGKGKSKR